MRASTLILASRIEEGNSFEHSSYSARNPKMSQDAHIDAALAGHLALLQSALYALLGACLGVVLGVFQIMHALVQVIYACVGLLVWSLGVSVVGLQAFRHWVDNRSVAALQKQGGDQHG